MPLRTHLNFCATDSLIGLSADTLFVQSSQYLEEDPKMNRINDSLQLFTMICSHELLKRVHLVLFLSRYLLISGLPSVPMPPVLKHLLTLLFCLFLSVRTCLAYARSDQMHTHVTALFQIVCR